MKNVVFCVDHEIGYDILNFALNNKSEKFNIVGIFTTDTNVSGYWKALKENNLLKSYDIYHGDEYFLDSIKEIEVDFIFLISWKYVISKKVIDKAKEGVINLHYSLLPKYRGVYPVNNAIICGEKETGITFHWIDENIDSGTIIIQKDISIEYSDTAYSLLKKLNKLALEAFKIIWKYDVMLYASDKTKIEYGIDMYYSKDFFVKCNEIDLDRNYKALELINLMRGKTFLDSKNLFFRDEYGNKIFISLNLEKENK
jgi:methionyl-tRNA formyltransferase